MKQAAIKKLQTIGFIEALHLGWSIYWEKITSVCKIFFLKLRGYQIDYSVKLHKNILFFQETKRSIIVGKNSVLGSGTRLKAFSKGKIEIAENVAIDNNTDLVSNYSVKIGEGTLIAATVYIIDCNHKLPITKYRDNPTAPEGLSGAPVEIGRHVWIGTHSVILQGVKIGDNSVIGAGSIVTKSVPPNSIAVGNPARVVKTLANSMYNI